jgi:anaerobic ribonucleoside-triphosphate reductase activating protein
MGDQIGLNRLHFPITALGPGRRIGIWLQGCSIRCPGCMSLDTWAPARTTISVAEVLERISTWLIEADGVTISGGEPFDQPEALLTLLSGLRAKQCRSILVYSGYPLDRLMATQPDALASIDVLISEPYLAEHTAPALLRGSSNQRVTCLTDSGVAMWREVEATTGRAPAVDLVAAEDGALWMAGIPRPGDLARLSGVLGSRGVTAKTSAGRLGGTS